MATETAYDSDHDTEPGGVPWLRQTKAFAVRNLRAMFREKATVIWGFGFPAFWYFLTSLMFLPSAENVGGPSALATIKGGAAVALGLFGVLTVTLVAFASGLATDLQEKRYRKLRSLPIAPSADFAGRSLAAVVVGAVSYLIVIVIGYLDGASYSLRGASSIPIVVGTFVLFSLVGVSIAVLVARFVGDPEYVTAIANAALLVSYFLTGYNGMSPGLLPEQTRWIVNVVPNSLAARLQTWHMTETASDGASSAGGWVASVPYPSGLEHVGLLLAWTSILGVVAVLVTRSAFYDGEGGE
jgi:ABC-2 type transport system permease protein